MFIKVINLQQKQSRNLNRFLMYISLNCKAIISQSEMIQYHNKSYYYIFYLNKNLDFNGLNFQGLWKISMKKKSFIKKYVFVPIKYGHTTSGTRISSENYIKIELISKWWKLPAKYQPIIFFTIKLVKSFDYLRAQMQNFLFFNVIEPPLLIYRLFRIRKHRAFQIYQVIILRLK